MSKRNFRIPSSPLGVILLFIAILLIYGLLSLLLIPYLMFDEWSLLDNIRSLIPDDDGNTSIHAGDLFVSFAASALQDIFFFLFTGLILLAFSMKKPEDENLAQKLTYLFPQAKEDQILREYLETSVNKLGCISDKSSFKFTILAHDESVDAFKIQVHFESHLRNLHNKDSYSDPMLGMSLESDLEDTPSNGLYGQLEHVKVYTFDKSGILDIIESSHEYPVNMTEKLFKHKCNFSVKPQSVALFDAKHWDWSPTKKTHNLRVSRFTRAIEFICINNSGVPVEIELNSIGSTDKATSKDLESHEHTSMQLVDVHPGKGISIQINTKTE